MDSWPSRFTSLVIVKAYLDYTGSCDIRSITRISSISRLFTLDAEKSKFFRPLTHTHTHLITIEHFTYAHAHTHIHDFAIQWYSRWIALLKAFILAIWLDIRSPETFAFLLVYTQNSGQMQARTSTLADDSDDDSSLCNHYTVGQMGVILGMIAMHLQIWALDRVER